MAKKIFTAAFLIGFLLVSIMLYGDPDGRTGRTLKTSTQGCGGCHGSSNTAGVSVVIGGPDTVSTGQTRQYSLTITRSTQTGAGLDIAVRQGSLSPVSTNIHLANGELTHNNNISMTSGTMTVQFNYVAPASPGIDTIWATGLATNSNGNSSGDEWNWAVSKRVVVRLPTGITNNESSERFELYQNFPNPFNPATKIKFQIPSVVPGQGAGANTVLKVYDDLGRLVQTIVNQKLQPGSYEFEFNGENIPGGVYLYELTYGSVSKINKMILIK